MKIGILTQHFLKNYGGILQNWALQQALLKLGHEPLTFEHDTCFSRSRWLMRTMKYLLTNRSLKHLPVYPYKGRVGHKPFIDFIIRNIRSVTVHDFTPDIERRYGCEAFIVGSDQVWRPAFNLGRLYNMYLDFASDSVRKVAYAASFGVSDWEYSEEEAQRCRDLAKRFDAVSVREDSGISLCREKLCVSARQVLDPTLLLDKQDYLPLCQDILEKRGTVFIYALHFSDKIKLFADNLAKKYGKVVNVLQAGDKLEPKDSIEQWVAMFRDADCVVTDSFHGMAFSIIFNKPFYIFKNESGGVARYYSLLQQFGLEHRIIEDGSGDKECEPIDWEHVNNKKKELQKSSIRFLIDSLTK